MALEVRVGGHPGSSRVLLARAMTAPRVPSTVGPILMAAHRAQPDNPVWLARVARMRFAAGDTTFVDSVLPALLRSRHPEALLFAAALAGRRGDQRARVALIREVVARGGDTAEAEAGLAGAAAHAGDWRGTVTALRLALAGGPGSYRHPFPAGSLPDPLPGLPLPRPPPPPDRVPALAAHPPPRLSPPYGPRATGAPPE